MMCSMTASASIITYAQYPFPPIWEPYVRKHVRHVLSLAREVFQGREALLRQVPIIIDAGYSETPIWGHWADRLHHKDQRHEPDVLVIAARPQAEHE